MSWRTSLVLSIVLAVAGSAVRVSAAPAEVFTDQLDEIRQNLPPGYMMRLPSQVLLGGPADKDFINELIVRVFSSTTPPSLTVGLFTCQTGIDPCLVGSFSVESQNSASAVRELRRHKAVGNLITLAPGIKGFLLEGPQQKPAHQFSSVIWQQNSMIHTVTFLAGERQNIMFMARSMALEKPIRRTDVSTSTSGVKMSLSSENLFKSLEIKLFDF